MYQVKPHNGPPDRTPCKSDVMYGLKSYHNQEMDKNENRKQQENGYVQEMDDNGNLESKQCEVIEKLQNLKKTLDKMVASEGSTSPGKKEKQKSKKGEKPKNSDDKKKSPKLDAATMPGPEVTEFAGLKDHPLSPTIQPVPIPQFKLDAAIFVNNGVDKSLANIQDISVNILPGEPNSWLLVLRQLMNDRLFNNVHVSTFHHSSLTQSMIESSPAWSFDSNSAVKLRLLWKQDRFGPQLCLGQNVPPLFGLAAVCKALGKMVGLYPSSQEPWQRIREDYWIDVACGLSASNKKLRQAAVKELNVNLGNNKTTFIIGDKAGLSDIMLLSCLNYLKLIDSPPNNVAKWIDACKNIGIQF